MGKMGLEKPHTQNHDNV